MLELQPPGQQPSNEKHLTEPVLGFTAYFYPQSIPLFTLIWCFSDLSGLCLLFVRVVIVFKYLRNCAENDPKVLRPVKKCLASLHLIQFHYSLDHLAPVCLLECFCRLLKFAVFSLCLILGQILLFLICQSREIEVLWRQRYLNKVFIRHSFIYIYMYLYL